MPPPRSSISMERNCSSEESLRTDCCKSRSLTTSQISHSKKRRLMSCYSSCVPGKSQILPSKQWIVWWKRRSVSLPTRSTSRGVRLSSTLRRPRTQPPTHAPPPAPSRLMPLHRHRRRRRARYPTFRRAQMVAGTCRLPRLSRCLFQKQPSQSTRRARRAKQTLRRPLLRAALAVGMPAPTRQPRMKLPHSPMWSSCRRVNLCQLRRRAARSRRHPAG
mmetsp:Transcript_3473/g.10667  ORF Transcript_3473/g.10667 Transcript_3473/m.10667 type:complete len:218 (+) Transcript_3473:1591-2244(+)